MTEMEAPGTDEAPRWLDLYRARDDEVSTIRPAFSGDVWADVSVPDAPNPVTVMILQHPCSIHQDVYLRDKLLVAEVVPQASPILPSQWRNGFARHLPLHLLWGDDHGVARYDRFHIAKKDALQSGRRIACLTQYGVSLMMQRWVYYNTRVIVPTKDFTAMTVPQFEETDMIEEWCELRADDGVSTDDSVPEIAAFFNEKPDDKITRREQLKDPSQRSRVRADLRARRRELLGR